MKKYVSAVLAAAMCFSAATIPAASAEDISIPEIETMKTADYGDDLCGPEAHWKLEGGTLTITGTGKMADWEKVTLSPWYEKMGEIHNVVISEGITTVGRACFLDAKSLTSVKLPSTITSINMSAFQGSSISSIDIPAACTTIGDKAFLNCGSLSEIIIRNGDCKIVTPGSFTGVSGTIVSPAGGTVEKFASSNNHSFKALDSSYQPQTTQTTQTTTATTTTVSNTTTVTTTAVPLKIDAKDIPSTSRAPGETELPIAEFIIRNVGVSFKEFEFEVKSDDLKVLEKNVDLSSTTAKLSFKTDIPAVQGKLKYTVTVTKATDANGNDLLSALPWTSKEYSIGTYLMDYTGTTATATTTSAATTTVTTTATTAATPVVTVPVSEAEVVFDFGNYTTENGKNVKVKVMADSKGAGIAAMDVVFKLDKGLKLESIAEESPAFSKAVMTNIAVLGANFTAIENGTGEPIVPDKDEPVFVLSVKVDDNAADGVYKIGFGDKFNVFRDATKNNFKIAAINGNITVKNNGSTTPPSGDALLGDANLDGIVDARDATLILTEYAKSSAGGSDPFSDNAKAAAVSDVNGDNIIDGRDATTVCTYYAYISVDGNPMVDLKTWLDNK